MQLILKIISYPLIFLIRIYQLIISPWLGPRCRFTPSCSVYAIEALRKYGLFKGDGWPFAAFRVVIPGAGMVMIRLNKRSIAVLVPAVTLTQFLLFLVFKGIHLR